MAVTPAPYTGTATGAKRALGWYSDSEINAPTTPAATNQTPQAAPATKPMVGPLTTGQTRPDVAIPTPTVTPKTPDVQNGRMPGPFIAPDGGVQQGANVVGGKIQYDQPTPKVATSDSGVPQSGLYQDQYARTPQQIADLARERIQKILQAGQTAATGALTGAKDAYNYTQKTTLGNRSLLQFDNSQRGDQFGGSAREDKFRLDRQQGIEDTATTNQYQANVAQINQKLADLQAAAPGDEAAIIDQLQQIERTTGISVAQLQEQQKQNQLGQSNADRNFNQNQQVINYNQDPNNPNNQGQVLQNQGQAQQNLLNQFKLNDYPAEQQAAAAKVKRDTEIGNMDVETAKYNLGQLKDPNSNYNQAAKIDLQMKQLDLKNAPEKARLEFQQLQKQIAQIGVVHYKPQTAAEIARDKVTLATATKQLADIAKGIYPGDKAKTEKPPVIDPKDSVVAYNHYKDQIDSSSYTKEQKQAFAESVKSEMTASDYAKLYNGIE